MSREEWHEKQYCTAGQKLLTKSTLSGKKPDRWVLCRSSISSLQMHQRLSIGVRISSAYGKCIRWVWCRGAIPLHHFDIASLLSSSSPPPLTGSWDPSSVHFQISTMPYPSSDFFFSFLGSLMHTHTHNLLQRNCNRKTHNLLTLIHTFRYPEKSAFLWVGHWFCNASEIAPTQFEETVWEGH